jgi:hypothetical protein
MEPPFDPYAALFSVAEVAEMAGVPRPIVDVWVTRKVIEPTRRQRPAAGKRYSAKKKKVTPRVGRPLFSCRDVFKALLVRVLADELALASPESSGVATLVALAKVADVVDDGKRGLVEIADVAAGGEWMWAVGRSIERGQSLNVYAYANRHGGEWRLDMHFGALGATPCFGWNVPNIFIPVGDIFAEAYRKCRELVGGAPYDGAHT